MAMRKENDMAVVTRASEEIKKDILEQLCLDSRVNAVDVEVEVAEGNVTLGGAVPTYAARLAAQEDASSVDGVQTIDNHLSVEPPEGAPPPKDEDICDRVLEAIRGEDDLEGADVHASVTDGWVTLRGHVDAYWQKLRAEELASTRAGVCGLTNELVAVPSGTHEDKLIADSIVAALEGDTHVDVDTIEVRVHGGKVTLSGSVSSLFAFQTAQTTAERTAGVVEVVNELMIG